MVRRSEAVEDPRKVPRRPVDLHLQRDLEGGQRAAKTRLLPLRLGAKKRLHHQHPPGVNAEDGPRKLRRRSSHQSPLERKKKKRRRRKSSNSTCTTSQYPLIPGFLYPHLFLCPFAH